MAQCQVEGGGTADFEQILPTEELLAIYGRITQNEIKVGSLERQVCFTLIFCSIVEPELWPGAQGPSCFAVASKQRSLLKPAGSVLADPCMLLTQHYVGIRLHEASKPAPPPSCCLQLQGEVEEGPAPALGNGKRGARGERKADNSRRAKLAAAVGVTQVRRGGLHHGALSSACFPHAGIFMLYLQSCFALDCVQQKSQPLWFFDVPCAAARALQLVLPFWSGATWDKQHGVDVERKR